MFGDPAYTGSLEGISTFFILPRKGLSIQYRVDENLGQFCKEPENKQQIDNFYRESCERYSHLNRTSIDIAFDKVSGTFRIK